MRHSFAAHKNKAAHHNWEKSFSFPHIHDLNLSKILCHN